MSIPRNRQALPTRKSSGFSRLLFTCKNERYAYHGVRLGFADEVGDNLALHLANVHEKPFCAAILVNGLEHALWRAANLLYVRLAINEMQQLNLTTIVKEDILLLGISL